MNIPATAAGRDAGENLAEASLRRLMAYAAGIGAQDECYFDDLAPGGLAAHPAFCVSLEWPVVSGPAYVAALGRPAGAPRAAVHVMQDSRFHRPIQAGMRLLTRARIVQVRPSSAGAVVTSRIDTLEAARGELLTTSWSSAIFLREAVDGPAASIEEPPALRAGAGLGVAPEGRIGIDTARGLAHRYTECAQIWNPIHTERGAARALGLPDVILHGTCTWALAMQALIARLADGAPGRLRRFAGRFKGMVLPGDRIEVEYGRDAGAWQFAVRTPRGELAISHGLAEFDR